MSIAISDEKINTKAAALEIVRHEIILEIKAEFDFYSKTWNSIELFKRIEIYLLKKHYLRFRRRIVESLNNDQQVSDHRVEVFLRTFVLESVVEENYNRVLDSLKINITTKLIKRFSLATLVFLPEVREAFDSRLHKDTIHDHLIRMTRFYAQYIDLDSHFDSYTDMIVSLINFYESKLESQTKLSRQMDVKKKDVEFSFAALERNCGILLDLCCEVLEAVITNYDCEVVKTSEELDKLRQDFKDYCRKLLVIDRRWLVNLNPYGISHIIIVESKDVWKEIKSRIHRILSLANEYTILMSHSNRVEFTKMFFKQYKDEMQHRLFAKFNLHSREDLFLYESYMKVEDKIEHLLSHALTWAITSKSDFTDSVEAAITRQIQNILNNGISKKYDYFPEDHLLDFNVLLSLRNRISIVKLACCSTPKTVDPKEYFKHYNRLITIAKSLSVDQETEVIEVLKLVTSLESKMANTLVFSSMQKKIGKTFDKQYDMGHPDVVYLVVGLYFLIGGADRDIQEILKAKEQNRPIKFKPVQYNKRRHCFQIIRFIKNGSFQLLNYHVVLIAESVLGRIQLIHNEKLISSEDREALNRQLVGEASYEFDHNAPVKAFRNAELLELTKFIGQPSNEHRSANASPDENFKSLFTQDMHFDDSKIFLSKGNIPMMSLNKKATLQKVNKTPAMKPRAGIRRLSTTKEDKRPKFVLSDIVTIRPLKERGSTASDEEEDIKMNTKLQYLKDNVPKFEFIDIHRIHKYRSRCPVLCLSGFMSEDSDKVREWSEMSDLFPFTEVITVNWASFTLKSIILTYYRAAMGISITALKDIIVEQMNEVIAERKKRNSTHPLNQIHEPNLAHLSNERSSPVGRLNIAHRQPQGQHPSQSHEHENMVASKNPFENDPRIDIYKRHQDDEEDDDEEGGILQLLRNASLSEILNKDTMIMTLLRILKLPQKIAEAQEPRKVKNKSIPAITFATGIYDFYEKNPFTMAYHHAVLAGQMMAILIAKNNLFNNGGLGILGFSLGSVFAFNACLILYDLGVTNKIGDLCLMGSCVDLMTFAQNLHKLIGTKGVVQGKLTVVWSSNDTTLSFLFKSARLGESPIGLKKLNIDFLSNCLKENDSILVTYSPTQLASYLRMKFENIDVSYRVFGHRDYSGKMLDIMQKVDFNSDLQFFQQMS